MLKLLGSLCILVAGGIVRTFRVQAFRREVSVLCGMLSALEEMSDEIRLNRTPLPRLLRQVGRGRGADVAQFFQTAAAAASGGESLAETWQTTALALPLAKSEQTAIAELGKKLCGDEKEACKGILLACNQMRKTIDEKRRQQPDVEKRSTALCFSGAALLIILLI